MRREDVLPPGWTWGTVEDVANIRDDLRQPVNADERLKRPGPYPYYGATGQVGWMDGFLMDGEYVLLGEDGAPFLDESKAKAYIVCGKCWVNNHAHVLQAMPDLASNRFLLHALNGADYSSFVNGTTRLKLTQGAMRSIPIALPPLAEQRRIVAAIEEHFTRLDAAVAALRRVQSALKRYRAAVLKAAVEGRLTEAWRAERPDVEPAVDARRRSLMATESAASSRHARRLWGAGHVASASDEVRRALPSTWELCKVRDLGADPTDVVQVGPMSMKSSEFTETGLPVLNVGCVRWGGLDLSKLNYLPSHIAARFTRYQLAPNDVVFTRSGTVGRCAIVGADQDGWLMTFHLLRVRADSRVCLPQYLTYVMEGSPHVREQIEGASIGSTRAGFNTRLLEELDVPLPPLREQEQIVAETEQRLSVLSELEATVEANLKRADRLRQSILEQAFSGRLVPQDPKDKPATTLLGHIREQRTEASQNGRSRVSPRQADLAGGNTPPIPATAKQTRLWDADE